MTIELQYTPPPPPSATKAPLGTPAALARSALDRLPCAHTCDNVLEVPDYWSALLASAGVEDGDDVPRSELAQMRQKVSASDALRSPFQQR